MESCKVLKETFKLSVSENEIRRQYCWLHWFNVGLAGVSSYLCWWSWITEKILFVKLRHLTTPAHETQHTVQTIVVFQDRRWHILLMNEMDDSLCNVRTKYLWTFQEVIVSCHFFLFYIKSPSTGNGCDTDRKSLYHFMHF